MSEAGRAVAFAAGLYRQQATVAYAGHVRRDPLALLNLRRGRADPYPVYERIRASGRLVPTRQGDWLTVSHRVCDSVLRNRRFGVHSDPDVEFSFLGMNPPDHTRLRRFALPAFSPKAVAGYAGRIRPGQRVVTLIGGANRDPEVFPEPGTFSIYREPGAEHLAFSSGIHYCLG